MVREGVERAARVYFAQGIAESTARRYEAAWRRYVALCTRLGEAPLPVTEDKAIALVVTLAEQGMRTATIKYHLAGLRQAQIKAGLPAPVWGAMARLGQIRTGIARHSAVHGSTLLERDPITPAHMRALQRTWSSKGEKGTMLWAAACMCFFGCLRAGEALAPDEGEFDPKAHLSFEDVTVDSLKNPEVVWVRIKESKTDRLRKGATVSLGRSGTQLCPVKAILEYIVQRKKGPGPFFRGTSDRGLTRKRFVEEVKAALEEAGEDSRTISGHSFRIGAATEAAKCGASAQEIKAMGRWRSREYQGYVRLDDKAKGEMAASLAKACEKNSGGQ